MLASTCLYSLYAWLMFVDFQRICKCNNFAAHSSWKRNLHRFMSTMYVYRRYYSEKP